MLLRVSNENPEHKGFFLQCCTQYENGSYISGSRSNDAET